MYGCVAIVLKRGPKTGSSPKKVKTYVNTFLVLSGGGFFLNLYYIQREMFLSTIDDGSVY